MHHSSALSARVVAFVALAIAGTVLATDASAQVSQRPGQYFGNHQFRVNPWNGSAHLPGQGVVKSDGRVYQPIGGGYYQNPWSGNKYNPHTGSYIQGTRPGFSSVEGRPNNYQRFGGIGVNPTTGSLHVPGAAVFKGSGAYQSIGGGYYRNPATGNTYNPYKGAYLRNW